MPSLPSPLRARARTLVVFATCAVIACLTPAAHAGPIEAPLELLHAPGNYVVAGPLYEINPSGRLVFLRKDVLSGKPRPPAKIDVHVGTAALANAILGERYIVGYSMYRSDRRLGTLVANPAGPTVLVSLGLEPALFRDTPAVRTLLKAGRSERGRESRRFRKLLMQALAGDDAQLQNLAAGEIALDPEVREQLRSADQPLVERVARDPKTPANVRALLLQTAAERPREFGNWWQAAATETVATTPVGGYASATSDSVGLVLTALDLLDSHGVTLPADALARWVRSGNPSLVERACLLLRRQDPAGERSAIQAALADSKLPGPTRTFLNDRLRRLDRHPAAGNTQKDGSD